MPQSATGILNCEAISKYDSEDDLVSDLDSDDEDDENNSNLDAENKVGLLMGDEGLKSGGESRKQPKPHDDPNSYAWLLMRLVSLWHLYGRLTQFISLAGFDLKGCLLALYIENILYFVVFFTEIPIISSKLDVILKLLKSWGRKLEEQLQSLPASYVENLLPNMDIDQSHPSATQFSVPLLSKYRVLLQRGNTPFEYDAKGVGKVRRLWSYLVHQDDLAPYFVRFIFARRKQVYNLILN